MAKLVVIHDNGEEEFIREITDDFYQSDILFRPDYIATKLWSPEDIEARMVDLGYEVTEERVDAVISNGGSWDGLGDCTDCEWDCIDSEIEDVACREGWERTEDEEDEDDEDFE